MINIHEVTLKNFLYLLLKELLKKHWCLTHKRCHNWTTKFDLTKFLSLNTKKMEQS